MREAAARRSWPWIVCIWLLGCVQAPAQPASLVDSPAPPGLPTTSGSIAFGNLGSQIESAEREIQRHPGCAPCRVSLADLLITRAQITGSVTDLEQALASTEAAVAASTDGTTLLGRARARAALHLFDAARHDALTARMLRAQPAEVLALIASLDEATGRLAEATAYWEQALEARATTTTFGHLAILAAAGGDMKRASDLFARAAAAYRDVAPFPVVWLELQEGLGWQAAGDIARARVLFHRAHDRLPQSLPVASHLAAVEEDPEKAIALLEPFVRAEDPEPAGQLATLLALRHRADEATALAAETARRFVDLLQKHPAAYADHAARFWLSPAGHDPTRALHWARVNLTNRETSAAFGLAFDAATAAREPGVVCSLLPLAWYGATNDGALAWTLDRAAASCSGQTPGLLSVSN